MESINISVGFRIREIRESQALSQEKLAELADLHRGRCHSAEVNRAQAK